MICAWAVSCVKAVATLPWCRLLPFAKYFQTEPLAEDKGWPESDSERATECPSMY